MIVIRRKLYLDKLQYLRNIYLISSPDGKFCVCAGGQIGILVPGEDPTNLAGTKRTPRDPLIGGSLPGSAASANFPEVSFAKN